MKYVLGGILLIALIVWIVHNVRAIIKMRKKAKRGGKVDGDTVDGNADSDSREEIGEGQQD